MEENNVQNTDQQEAAANNSQREEVRTFTQEEVNEIVEKRLNRERKKFTSIINADDPRERDLAERERTLLEKELRLDAEREFKTRGLPEEAMELLNYTDKESCDKSIKLLESILRTQYTKTAEKFLRGGRPIKKASNAEGLDLSLRDAFGLGKHVE